MGSISVVRVSDSGLHEFVYETEFGNRIALGTSEDKRRDSMSTIGNLDESHTALPTETEVENVELAWIPKKSPFDGIMSKKQKKKLEKEEKKRKTQDLFVDEDQVPQLDQEEDTNEPLVLSRTVSPDLYSPEKGIHFF
jgi:hypothetical protein